MLLGAGLADVGLSQSARGIELLEQGLLKAVEVSAPDLQLKDLVAMAKQALADLK